MGRGLAVHQLRRAPDCATALSLPLPLHLAGPARVYVLPMLVEMEWRRSYRAEIGSFGREPTAVDS
ncbi:RNaseH domain-containing protein [Streptomyces sp. NPDC006289]|uniref:RNaseH domain-containing protein n=1 Tax=Streptomyces sp. NPDC006289 TaxID=3156744 RepID=UPI00339F0B70